MLTLRNPFRYQTLQTKKIKLVPPCMPVVFPGQTEHQTIDRRGYIRLSPCHRLASIVYVTYVRHSISIPNLFIKNIVACCLSFLVYALNLLGRALKNRYPILLVYRTHLTIYRLLKGCEGIEAAKCTRLLGFSTPTCNERM